MKKRIMHQRILDLIEQRHPHLLYPHERECLAKKLDEMFEKEFLKRVSLGSKYIEKLEAELKKTKQGRDKLYSELELKNYYIATVKGLLLRGNSFLTLVDQLKELEKHPAKMKMYSMRMVDIPNISVRMLNALKCHDIYTIGDIFNHKKDDFIKFKNFGFKSLRELEEILNKMGLIWE